MVSSTVGESRAAPLNHACCAYDDLDALEARAEQFLAEGAVRGERVRYIGLRRPAWLHRDEEFVSIGAVYGDDVVIDPDAQVAAYAAGTEQALADGHAGLRVVADVTTLVRTPEQLDAFARYEHRVDRYMRTHPFAAICAYDRRVLGDRAIAQVACLHPDSDADVLFHLYAAPTGGTALTGELDLSSRELFATALQRAEPPADGGVLTLDASGLRFIDHRTLCDLEEYALAHDVDLVLTGADRSARHLVELMDLTAVQVEAAA